MQLVHCVNFDNGLRLFTIEEVVLNLRVRVVINPKKWEVCNCGQAETIIESFSFFSKLR